MIGLLLVKSGRMDLSSFPLSAEKVQCVSRVVEVAKD
jgi:hypothetical protein